jgi:amidase
MYPSWSIPPRLIGDLNTPSGGNSGRLASPAAFPVITVPMGYVRGDLPIGLEFLSIPWSEPALIELVYLYEQATKHRRLPRRCRRWLLTACHPRGQDIDS